MSWPVSYENAGTPDEDMPVWQHDLGDYRGGERKLLAENDVLKAKLSSLQATTCPVSEKQAVEDELHATAVALKKLQEDYYVLADELDHSRVAFGKEGKKSIRFLLGLGATTPRRVLPTASSWKKSRTRTHGCTSHWQPTTRRRLGFRLMSQALSKSSSS